MSITTKNRQPYAVADTQYKGEYKNSKDSYATEGRLAKMTRPVSYDTGKPKDNYAYTYTNCKHIRESPNEYYKINRAYAMMPR